MRKLNRLVLFLPLVLLLAACGSDEPDYILEKDTEGIRTQARVWCEDEGKKISRIIYDYSWQVEGLEPLDLEQIDEQLDRLYGPAKADQQDEDPKDTDPKEGTDKEQTDDTDPKEGTEDTDPDWEKEYDGSTLTVSKLASGAEGMETGTALKVLESRGFKDTAKDEDK